MANTNKVEVKFQSLSENESFARIVVAAFLSQIDPTVDELYDIKMAVSEAVTNSIIHGYNHLENEEIEMICSYEGRRATIEIKDKGKGIPNVDEAMKALYTTCEESERAGLGFTVMQSSVDQVEVTSKVGEGTVVTLTKTFA